ncbi:hypothetical protein EBB07_20510 [Paenibacillaceae bacterium]|nr:hypothetical protein EBB07_20510 [Paenibacillaceae bacterium]
MQGAGLLLRVCCCGLAAAGLLLRACCCGLAGCFSSPFKAGFLISLFKRLKSGFKSEPFVFSASPSLPSSQGASTDFEVEPKLLYKVQQFRIIIAISLKMLYKVQQFQENYKL